ncbi:MAG: arabinogalactan endo-beta-1,4-galactanase [Flavobacterium sp.]
MKKLLFAILLLTVFLQSCQKETPPAFAKGADVSWLPQMEATGYQFLDENGQKADVLHLLKDRGMDAVRLRIFVNPSDNPWSGHCDKDATVAMALRAQKMGMQVMANFHYSDSWADPGKQNKPEAWKDLPFDELVQAVYDHTYEVVSALKNAGVTPEWVQVGNEIPGGMLWPDGHTDQWPQLAQLLNAGYKATKAVDPNIRVIVHVDEGHNQEKFRNFYDRATELGVQYDIIGLSYYPYWVKKDWTETIDGLRQNLIDLVERYDKDVMVVEVGGEDHQIENTRDLLKATIEAVRNVPNGRGLGVFYWEPQGARSWSKYGLSAWGEDGKPSPALDAFKE